MRYVCLLRTALLLALPALLAGQHRVDPRHLYERVMLIVPMVGAGTAADPPRPLYAPLPSQGTPLTGAGIMAFCYVTSDDGKLALVELVARDRAAFRTILAERRAGVRVFERGATMKDDVERAFRAHKPGFRMDTFQGVGVR